MPLDLADDDAVVVGIALGELPGPLGVAGGGLLARSLLAFSPHFQRELLDLMGARVLES